MIQLLKFFLKDKGYRNFIDNKSNVKKVLRDLSLNFDDTDSEMIVKFNQTRNKIFKNISEEINYGEEFNNILHVSLEFICALLNKFFGLDDDQAKEFGRIFRHVHSVKLKEA